jgi:riboflavin synthase
MFSGIIEATGEVVFLKREQSNLHVSIRAPFTNELKIDQSISHNGICLTVVELNNDTYTVTAIDETLQKTNLGSLKMGDAVNLERCLRVGDRLDGHIVQGHVDQTATCTSIEENGGSWTYTFNYDSAAGNITVEKGSVCVNGVSLTVVNSKEHSFSVCIIPYTYEHTNFKSFQKGTIVNLEFDILGKYISKLLKKSV